MINYFQCCTSIITIELHINLHRHGHLSSGKYQSGVTIHNAMVTPLAWQLQVGVQILLYLGYMCIIGQLRR